MEESVDFPFSDAFRFSHFPKNNYTKSSDHKDLLHLHNIGERRN